MKNIMAVVIFTLVIGQVQAESVTVPNGSFELIYKPGSTAITAELANRYTWGVGPNSPMNNPSNSVTYSDGATGALVDIPGWINAPDWPIMSGWTQGSGSVTKRSELALDGDYYFMANGADYGNPHGGAIESDAPLTTIASDRDYTVSMFIDGPVVPVVLDLLANDVVLAPSFTADPGAPYV